MAVGFRIVNANRNTVLDGRYPVLCLHAVGTRSAQQSGLPFTAGVFEDVIYTSTTARPPLVALRPSSSGAFNGACNVQSVVSIGPQQWRIRFEPIFLFHGAADGLPDLTDTHNRFTYYIFDIDTASSGFGMHFSLPGAQPFYLGAKPLMRAVGNFAGEGRIQVGYNAPGLSDRDLPPSSVDISQTASSFVEPAGKRYALACLSPTLRYWFDEGYAPFPDVPDALWVAFYRPVMTRMGKVWKTPDVYVNGTDSSLGADGWDPTPTHWLRIDVTDYE